jgi:hypothetical protein
MIGDADLNLTDSCVELFSKAQAKETSLRLGPGPARRRRPIVLVTEFKLETDQYPGSQ